MMILNNYVNFLTHVIVYYTVKTVTLDITKSLIIAPETLGTSAGSLIQPWQMTIRARALYVSAH